jgi:hypothetical protein
LAAGATTDLLVGGGAAALPVWTTATGTGAPVRATSPTLVTPLLGTPTSGVLTNCTGLPVAGIVASTSTALGVGSIELGAAADTTLSRSAAGQLAVEGVVVPTISSTNTLSNKSIDLGTNPVTGTIAQFNTACTDADFSVSTHTHTGVYAPVASPTFTGTVTAPALVVDTLTGVLRADAGTVAVDTDVTDIVSVFTTTVKGAVPPPTTTTGKFLKDDGTWASPASEGAKRMTQIYTIPGPLAPGTGVTEFVVTLPGDVVNVWSSVTNTFTGSSVLVDVNINGTTIFATQANRPTIAAGNRRDTAATVDTGAFVAGDRITVDVDQTGTHAAADQITVGVEYTYD